jgi:uncharacterized membrane protein
VPGVVAVLVVTLRSEDASAGFGANDAVAPAGTPVMLRLISPAKPYRVTVMVYVVVPPAVTVWLGGDALIP